MASSQASPNTQATVAADNAPLPCRETMTPGVVNDRWDLHMEWLELMNDLVPDMIQAQRYHNDGTLRRFWAFVYHQFEDIYPARDWTEWTTENDLRVAEMECRVAGIIFSAAFMVSLQTVHNTLPDARTLQNQAKSHTYYSRNRKRILVSLAEKYQTTKKLERALKKCTDEQKRAHARNSAQSYQKNREVILERRRLARLATRSADSNESTVSQPLRKKTPKEPPTCPQESVVAQYVERVYREFRFLFRRDGTYDDGQDSVFEPRVEEMDALSTHAMRCVDAILNIDGYGANYLKADGLAAEVTTVGGWIVELEIETINDPTELIKLHRKRQLMYQL
ncbi:hypothetical protein ARMGADRAFT_1086578 [Armillaria gallica]|uniref:Uncharacterized protein n=1 Tax=Armillaria gallica TaxID=47427 RepID=A0A2H3DDS6_ARMGA|nr:hypothetical protein ARMGADRAFT_1086578 [Armillaria gallica]